MAKGTTEIKYEDSEDLLSVWNGKPSIAAIEIGDFVIDIDSQGYVVGLEIIHASEKFGEYSNSLNDIEKASMLVIYKPNFIYITLNLKLNKKDKNISIPLMINHGHKKIHKEQFNLIE